MIDPGCSLVYNPNFVYTLFEAKPYDPERKAKQPAAKKRNSGGEMAEYETPF